MPTTAHPIEQLEQIASEFHHLRNEYKREGEQGSTRRTMGIRLEELDNRFDSLLMHWVEDEPERKAWHEHLHHDGSLPTDDLEHHPPLFVGRSASGSELQIRINTEGTNDVLIDGVRADRVSSELTFPQHAPAHILGQEWTEITHTPESALEALRSFYAQGKGKGKGTPPWQWSRVLYADGLIDVNFSLTPRGRRIIDN